MNSTRSEREAKSNRAPCIWMQAGVVRRKACEIDYQCETCRFDRALGRVARENRALRQQGKVPAGRREKIVFWKERLRELSAAQPCQMNSRLLPAGILTMIQVSLPRLIPML